MPPRQPQPLESIPVPAGRPSDNRAVGGVCAPPARSQPVAGQRPGLRASPSHPPWATYSGSPPDASVGRSGVSTPARATSAQSGVQRATWHEDRAHKGGLRKQPGRGDAQQQLQPPWYVEPPAPHPAVKFRGTESLASFHFIDQDMPPDARLSHRFGSTKATTMEKTINPALFNKLPPVSEQGGSKSRARLTASAFDPATFGRSTIMPDDGRKLNEKPTSSSIAVPPAVRASVLTARNTGPPSRHSHDQPPRCPERGI